MFSFFFCGSCLWVADVKNRCGARLWIWFKYFQCEIITQTPMPRRVGKCSQTRQYVPYLRNELVSFSSFGASLHRRRSGTPFLILVQHVSFAFMVEFEQVCGDCEVCPCHGVIALSMWKSPIIPVCLHKCLQHADWLMLQLTISWNQLIPLVYQHIEVSLVAGKLHLKNLSLHFFVLFLSSNCTFKWSVDTSAGEEYLID